MQPLQLFSGLAAADGMPVFEHFPKRNIANERDDDDCYEDELAELPYDDKPFQHPSENIGDFQDGYEHDEEKAPEVHTSGFFGMGSPMIPSQVSTPKWMKPTKRPALTIEDDSSGYEEKKKSATSYVSMSRPKKQATSYVSQTRPSPTERSSHRKKDASSYVTFSLDAKQQKVRSKSAINFIGDLSYRTLAKYLRFLTPPPLSAFWTN